MIIVHSSYGKPSAAWKYLAKSDKDIRGRIVDMTVAKTARYGDKIGVMPSSFMEAISDPDFRSMTGIARHTLIRSLINRIPQWGALYHHFSATAVKDYKIEPWYTPSSSFMKENLVGGLATMAYLRANRYTRNVYSDITIACVLIRENYEFFPNFSDDVSSGLEYRDPFFLMGNGYHPDPDMEDPSGFAPAVGLGQRHPNRWRATCKYLGITKSETVLSTYLSLGMQPWWLQVMLMQADLFMLSAKYPWYINPPTSSGSSLMSARLPYYYAGNPALTKLSLTEIDKLPENRGVQAFLAQNDLPILSNLLANGVPLSYTGPSVLFRDAHLLRSFSDASETALLQHLIAGIGDDTDLFGPTASSNIKLITTEPWSKIQSSLSAVSDADARQLVETRSQFERVATPLRFKFDLS